MKKLLRRQSCIDYLGMPLNPWRDRSSSLSSRPPILGEGQLVLVGLAAKSPPWDAVRNFETTTSHPVQVGES